jgi:hypothetical protein
MRTHLSHMNSNTASPHANPPHNPQNNTPTVTHHLQEPLNTAHLAAPPQPITAAIWLASPIWRLSISRHH